MRRHITSSFLCCFLIVVILNTSCIAKKGKRRRLRRRRHSCLQLNDTLHKAYFAQVDLIRRGLPTRVVQSEFTWAINYLMRLNPSYKYDKLKRTCIHKVSWNKVFDASHRAKFSIKYLEDIRVVAGNITFLNFASYPTLPPMDPKSHKLVETMWKTVAARLEKRPHRIYKVSDFPFPKNVDVLHDPRRQQACEQYNKFRTYSSSKHDADAKTVLIALTIVSVNLYRKGGNIRSIAQMLKHFVAYAFNGVRCLRLEGPDIMISRALVGAYSRNIAMIRSKVTKGIQDHKILPAAVERVFKEELHSLLSYNSWGHLRYAVLTSESSPPVTINVISNIFGRNQYRLLMLYSKTPKLLTSQRFLSDQNLKRRKMELNISDKKSKIKCDDGYILMQRETEVSHPSENCCNEICYQWSELISAYVTYSAEACCSRCNQLNRCESDITQQDLSDNNYYSFYVPEYGEQDQIDMYLVAL